ncbi:MAG: hypothetical protein UY48_C0031G0004 [Candidatus Gottesmanbacteria bacterium GW2011_GWB1_49_7]|uniref:Uncharacterized protein n=1 Tax=Candidatus Gottesmanbacteria bacterium GW2011_GWB1_49_7 TaxID=1618448 RepID=A0A0G1VWQ5_9BACT|nr:MAG: hypothetical protein UY48_C0031G0004 [Candidatus Gottesmanbacteria bacterium GW2011_GWB1_49_7]
MKLKISVGQPKRLVKKASRDGAGRVKLREGENLLRVLFGPVVVNNVFWPSIQREEDGAEKSVIKSARVPDRGSIFHPLAALDRKIQRANGVEKPQSPFDVKSKWNYLVIPLDEEPLEVKVAQLTKTVFEGLVEAERARDRDDPTKLRYGLIWMWNAIITKDVDPGKSKRYGTDYRVSVDTKNPFAGQVPAEWLDTSFQELVDGEFIDLHDVFSDEMLKALEDAEFDLEAEGVPEDETTIMERLQSFPINIDAIDSQTEAPTFRYKDDFMQQLAEHGLLGEIPIISATDKDQPRLTAGPTRRPVEAEVIDADDDVDDDVDDDDVVVVEAPPQTTSKARVRSLLLKADKAASVISAGNSDNK